LDLGVKIWKVLGLYARSTIYIKTKQDYRVTQGLGAKQRPLLLPLDREAMEGLTGQITGDSAA
jgi:hypothetical protein